MNRYLAIAVCVLFCGVVCEGGAFKIGAHGAYTAGGDVREEEAGYGAQLGIEFNDVVSAEVAGTYVQDELLGIDLDIYMGAITLRLGAPLGEFVSLYGGGGITYTRFELDWPGVKQEDDVGFHACGGIEIDLADTLELFAEYRYSFVEYDAQSGGGSLTFEEQNEYEYGLIRVGLNIQL